jgi:hypothetical protein
VSVTPGTMRPHQSGFAAGSSAFIALIIEEHSDVAGLTKKPARVILNFFVDDAFAEH